MKHVSDTDLPTGNNGRILFCDDDPFYREMASEMLAEAGYTVETATNGAEAIAAVDAGGFDLAIVDLAMGDITGFDVIEHVRVRNRNADLPILVITGHDDTESIGHAFELGATSFLAKPLNWLLFVHHVRFLLKSSRAQIELRNVSRMADFLSNLKTRIVGTLVSEFQSPLKTAFAFARLLKQEADGPLPSELYRTWVSEMYEALNRLSTTHGRMINFGRLLSDGIVLNEETAPIQDLLNDVVKDVLIPATRRNITIDLQNSSPERLKLHADRSLLNQALRIILDRSVKLAQRSSRAIIKASHAADGSLLIEIEDASANLTHAQIDDIMDAGRVTPGPVADTFEQITGLKMTRVIVEAHQGTFAMTSRADAGMHFAITLPAKRVKSGEVAGTFDRLDAVSRALSGLRNAPQHPPLPPRQAELQG